MKGRTEPEGIPPVSGRVSPVARVLLGTLFLAGAARPGGAGAQDTLRYELTTEDGVRVPAVELSPSSPSGRPFVLLFHQGGASGWAEYEPIAPRLVEAGYRVLLIDQRRGGELFGGTNPVSARFDPETTTYCEAMPDLEAALDHARATEPSHTAVLWGSSYSAALVIQLAAQRPEDVAGVLAFSPASGDPMVGCRPEPWAEELAVPLLAVRPSSEMEHAWIGEQLDRFGSLGHQTYVADPGRHGSSTLVEQRVGADTSETWRVVERFLASLRSSSTPDQPAAAR
jgi:pimeloyl-ACP methyl ester carboxylesterase